jgi:hypothetical protein
LSIPIEDRCAIRLVLADTSTRDLDRARARMRRQMEGGWLAAADALGVDPTRARAMLWTVMNAFLALTDLVDREEIDVAMATSIVNDLVASLAAYPPSNA